MAKTVIFWVTTVSIENITASGWVWSRWVLHPIILRTKLSLLQLFVAAGIEIAELRMVVSELNNAVWLVNVSVVVWLRLNVTTTPHRA